MLRTAGRLFHRGRQYGLRGSVNRLPRTVQWYLSQFLQRRFDRRHGTDTTELVSIRKFAIASDNFRHGEDYEATPPWAFRRVLRALPAANLGDFVFVDLGCGKGRALLAASAFKFKRIIGVEFSQELCAIARSNVAAFERSTGRRVPITIAHEDAAAFEPPDENCLFYLFNPFDATVTGRVAANIDSWAQRNGRKAFVVYMHPLHAEAFVRCRHLRKIGEAGRIFDPHAAQRYGYCAFESAAA
jgi:SAM-dependent methyltransferase